MTVNNGVRMSIATSLFDKDYISDVGSANIANAGDPLQVGVRIGFEFWLQRSLAAMLRMDLSLQTAYGKYFVRRNSKP